MSIKKSSLEQKWYYRIAKVIFLWVPPILVAVAILLIVFVDIRGTEKDAITALQKDIPNIIFAIIGLVLYFLILKGIWRGFLYVAFGGLEDDVAKKAVEVVQPISSSGASALNPADKKQIVEWVLMLIALACIYYVYFIYKSPQPIRVDGGSGKTTSTCISTGCGSNWLCNGSYYSDGIKKSVNGCYPSKTQATTLPSWSGICRQCP